MQPILLTTQLIDGAGAHIGKLLVVPVKRGEVAPGSFDVNLSMAHTGHVRGLVMPPPDCDLPPGRVVVTAWGTSFTPHIARWTPQLAQDTWETIMGCATFTCALHDEAGGGLFHARIFVGLMADDAALGELEPLEIEQWTAPAGRLAWLVALGKHLADPAADDLRMKAAMKALEALKKEGADLRPEMMERGARRCAERLGEIMGEWARWTSRQQLREREPAAAAVDVVMRLIELMEQLGEQGKGQGEYVRDVITKRPADELILRRVDDASFDAPMLKPLIIAIWHDEIRPRLETHVPALARALVHDGLLPILARRVEIRDSHIIDRDGGGIVAELPPSVDAAFAERIAQPGALDVFGHVHAHRLINHVARTVHEQKESGISDYRSITFEGGFSGLREAISYRESKNDELKELLYAGQYLEFSGLNIQGGGLWTWTNKMGPRGFLKIVAGDPLLPNFNAIYKDVNDTSRRARRLIPVLEHEPRLDMLNPRSQGPALTLVWLMLVELRDHAERLATNGAIRTTEGRWRAMGERAGLPPGTIGGILEAWSDAGDGAVQLIERTGAEWTLAEPHALARDFIIEAGHRALEGAKNGRLAKGGKKSKASMGR
jgi:hypothetical protein